MMSVLFQREPDGFWQVAPRERPLWALVVALAMLALFVAALCMLAVGARAAEERGAICSQKHCYCDAQGCLGSPDQATLDGMIAARAADAKRWDTKICHAGVCTVCYVGGDCMVDVPEDTISYPTAGQLTTNVPIAAPCTGCILVDGKWVLSVPPGFHRTRCLPVGSDQIVDCWVETKP